MNGREIENLLSVIDESISGSKAFLRVQILQYLRDHEQEVLLSLRSSGKILVPTTSGSVELLLPELQALVA